MPYTDRLLDFSLLVELASCITESSPKIDWHSIGLHCEARGKYWQLPSACQSQHSPMQMSSMNFEMKAPIFSLSLTIAPRGPYGATSETIALPLDCRHRK